MKEKTKHHKHNISAGFHPGIDKKKKKVKQYNTLAGFAGMVMNLSEARISTKQILKSCSKQTPSADKLSGVH